MGCWQTYMGREVLVLLLITDYKTTCIVADHREKKGEGFAAEVIERGLGHEGDINFVTRLKFYNWICNGIGFCVSG